MQDHSCLSLPKYCGMRKQARYVHRLQKAKAPTRRKSARSCNRIASMLWPLDCNIDLLGHCVASIFSTAHTFWFKLRCHFMFIFAELCWNQNHFSTASTLQRNYVTERVLAVIGKNFEKVTTVFNMQALMRKSLQKEKKKLHVQTRSHISISKPFRKR